MDIIIRPAEERDAAEITRLVQELTVDWFEVPPVCEEFVKRYLKTPNCGILVAEHAKKVMGLLSYTVRLNLSHAAETAIVEELIVNDEAREVGVGSALLEGFMAKMQARGCVEVSVSVMAENPDAVRFYRTHGMTEEAIFLERHFS